MYLSPQHYIAYRYAHQSKPYVPSDQTNACLLEAAPRGQADQVAKHEAGEGLPAADLLPCHEADGQLESPATVSAVEAHQADVVEDLHVSLIQLSLQQALDTLQRCYRTKHCSRNRNSI